MFQHLAREASKLHSLSLFKVHELVNLRVQAFLQVQRFLSQALLRGRDLHGHPGSLRGPGDHVWGSCAGQGFNSGC